MEYEKEALYQDREEFISKEEGLCGSSSNMQRTELLQEIASSVHDGRPIFSDLLQDIRHELEQLSNFSSSTPALNGLPNPI